MNKNSGAASLGLVGDIGGTNSRFAIVARGETRLDAPKSYANADYQDIYGALERYLRDEGGGRKLDWAVIAVAGPVKANAVSLTNRTWRIDGKEIGARFNIADARLVNDFSALAAAAPHLPDKDRVAIGAGVARAQGGVTTLAVVGPGTGLGVGGLVRTQQGDVVLTTEGGHATYAPVDDVERAVVEHLLKRFERVSYERLLCGEGLGNIREALCAIEGVAFEKLAPSEITRRAGVKADAQSVRAVEVFTRGLGSFAGDVALTMGARGGVYIAGGMVPAIIDFFDREAFRARFDAKGRFETYMREIPVWVINAPFTALLGCAALAGDHFLDDLGKDAVQR